MDKRRDNLNMLYSPGAARMKNNIVNVDGANGDSVATVVDEGLKDESPGRPTLNANPLPTPNGTRVRHVDFDRMEISVLRPLME